MILKVLGFKAIATNNGSGVHGVHFFHHESPKTKHQMCARNPIFHFEWLFGPSFCYTDFTELYVSLIGGECEGLPDPLFSNNLGERKSI